VSAWAICGFEHELLNVMVPALKLPAPGLDERAGARDGRGSAGARARA